MSKVENAAKAAQKQVKPGFSIEQLQAAQLAGERLGRKQVIDALNEIFNETDFISLAKIKETKAYKGLQVVIDGEPVTIRTFEEYCLHVEGKSRQSVDGDLMNLKQLGKELFFALHGIGLGQVVMRKYCKLSDAERQALLEAAGKGDKASFVKMAATLINKQ
jgi:hypothetical protein